jgi:hypothetical protein
MRKKLLWAFFLLILFIGIILFLTARYADRIVEPYVRSLLEQNKPMKHRIDYRQIRVNLVNKYINIKDVRIYPDSSIVKDENVWLEVFVEKIRLTDFGIMDMLLHKRLSIGDLIMLNPDVAVNLPITRIIPDLDEEVMEESPPKSTSQLLTSISFERVMLEGGIFRLIRNEVILARSNNISFIAEQISLVKNTKDDPVGYTYGDVRISLSEIILRSETGLYDMSLEKLIVNKLDSTILLEGFRMSPKYSKQEFSGKLEFQNDRFDVSIESIGIERIGFRRLLAGQPLEIGSLRINKLYADIYRDKNVATDTNRFPLFYNESFLKVKLPLLLDTVMISNSNIKYGELAEGKANVGEITLEDFNLSTYLLSNYRFDSTSVNEMRLFINANIMGEGPLNVELVLPLEGKLHNFECTGSVGAMKLSPLNGMVEPSMNMTFRDGKLNRMTFYFSADDKVSRGWMEFLYQDLDVVLLKKDQAKEWGFVSFLANSIALSNNPASGKDLKIVEIGYERNINKGIINYIWKTIQSGMVRTISPEKKYQINKRQAEKAKKKDAVIKKEKEKGTEKQKKKKN